MIERGEAKQAQARHEWPTNERRSRHERSAERHEGLRARDAALAADDGQITLISSAKLHWELQEVLSEHRPGLTDITPEDEQLVQTLLNRAGKLRRDPQLRNPLPLSADREDDLSLPWPSQPGQCSSPETSACLNRCRPTWRESRYGKR